jgi:hypothetical protein
MPLWGKRDQLSDVPKQVFNDKNQTGTSQYGNTVFGVDVAEVTVNPAAGHTGWVKRTVGTGGRSGRIQYEVLVAGSISGDSTSFANGTSTTIANTTGTADDTIFPDS